MAISTIGTDALASAAVTSAKLASGAPSRSQLPGGTVLQVVNATYNSLSGTTSATLSDTGLSASITPTSATNKILVLVNMSGVSKTGVNTGVRFVLLRGSTSIIPFEGLAAWTNSTSNASGTGSCNYLDSPATTSLTTYKVQFSNEDATGTVYVNNAGSNATSTCTMTLMEIAA